MNDGRSIWRIAVSLLLVTSAFTGLGARLTYLHLGSHEDTAQSLQKSRSFSRNLDVDRGRIFDRNGYLLAQDLPARDICLSPASVTSNGYVRFTSRQLSRVLHLDAVELEQKIVDRRRMQYMRLKRFSPLEEAEQIKAMNLPGVFMREVKRRSYTHGSLMCHALGFVNWEGQGTGGIEQILRRYLTGHRGLLVGQRSANRSELYNRRILQIEPQHGADIHLTLDHHLQYIMEEALDEAMEAHHAKGAWALVQDVKTGEILAMASRPFFNLNDFRYSTDEERRNRTISYVYEPGSTFKTIIVAAALNEGLIAPDDPIDCEKGVWYYGRRPLHDHHAYDVLSVADVLKKSSNIGAAKIALMLGEERLERYIRLFGIGSITGIELPGEEAGLFYPPLRWSAISATRIAMGHEVSVTALQMLNAVNAIANDGLLMKPTIVSRMVDASGRTLYEAEPVVMGRPIKSQTAEMMRFLMARIVGPGGTGRRAQVDGYMVSGKTGTAQKPVNGTYSSSAHMASFVGFLPAENPEISLIVVIDEPQPIHTGGVVAAPVFKKIAEQAVRYLDIRPAQASEFAKKIEMETNI